MAKRRPSGDGMVHSALKAAEQAHIVAQNPAEGVSVKRAKNPVMQVLNDQQIEMFFKEISTDPHWHDFFYTAITTGLRRGELCGLQWDDLDFATGELSINKQVYRVNGKLVVSTPKTKASIRSLVLPQSIRPVLEVHRKNTHSRWMFPSPVINDAPLDPITVRKKLQRIFDHAQCKRVRFHDLRHTFQPTH